MRLSQIARKLNVTQGEITKLLVQAGMESPIGGNTKLTEKQLALIFEKYGEIEAEQELDEEEVAQVEVEIESVPEVKEVEVEEEVVKIEEEIVAPVVAEIPEEIEEEIEVIRVKKIKLDGIKVVGKIDLPEPKVKKVEQKAEDPQEVDKPKQSANNQRFSKQNRRKPHKKAPLTFEQKQALEEKKRLKAKKERERKQKEKKRAYYENQVLKKKVAAPKKKKTTAPIQETQASKRTKIETRNPFKKFWIWLNDPYA